MRIRFFATILAVLFVVSVLVIILHASLLQKERLLLIDQQLRATAAILIDSELGDLQKINFKRTEALISEELGEGRLGKFFVVRNSEGKIIFKSANANDLPVDQVPRHDTWQTVRTPNSYIRVINFKLPQIPDRTLQVGIVVSHEIINPSYLSPTTFTILFAILTVGSIASFFLTSFLLRPIARLSEFIRNSSEKIKSGQLLSKAPMKISGKGLIDVPPFSKYDEYQNLILGYNILIDRVNKYYKNSKLWAYQMAHELKTPLTLISLEVENLEKQLQDKSKVKSVQLELQKIASTVSSFLSWAELDNSTVNKHLFANKLAPIVRSVMARLNPQSPNIELKVIDEITVFCNPTHLEQLIINLLTNALSHTKSPQKVYIVLQNNYLEIQDHGPGIPSSVIERMGEPFNKGSSSEGFGLGLAWVSSLCQLYNWELSIDSKKDGTRIRVDFTKGS